MLTLFTNITEQLTEKEKDVLVPMLVNMLHELPQNSSAKGSSICKWFNNAGHKTSEPRLRKMINYIRTMNLCKPAVLIGSGCGYFITDDIRVIDEQIESLEGRIDSMKAVVDSMKAQKDNLKHSSK
jgi:hypothetical protein